jgi:hypothetical protein
MPQAPLKQAGGIDEFYALSYSGGKNCTRSRENYHGIVIPREGSIVLQFNDSSAGGIKCGSDQGHLPNAFEGPRTGITGKTNSGEAKKLGITV